MIGSNIIYCSNLFKLHSILSMFTNVTAESDEEKYSGQFLDAIIWAVKLGHAGKLGYHVVLRRPTQLTKPTPVRNCYYMFLPSK